MRVTGAPLWPTGSLLWDQFTLGRPTTGLGERHNAKGGTRRGQWLLPGGAGGGFQEAMQPRCPHFFSRISALWIFLGDYAPYSSFVLETQREKESKSWGRAEGERERERETETERESQAGSVLSEQSREPAYDSVSPSFSAPPPLTLSLK